MSEEAEIAARVESLIAAQVAALGIQLLEVQYLYQERWVLRLIIDRKEGIGLDECGAVSELASRILDVEDPIPNSFSLEVSSPGLFRPLRNSNHFRQSVGKIVRFTLAEGFLQERKNRELRGLLAEVQDETAILEMEGERIELPMEAIRAARLDPDF